MKESASFLKKLFDEKKYLEIVNIIDNEIEKEKLNSGLINLSGVCKLLINKSKNNLEKSIEDFMQHRFNIILKARQLGISTLTAGYALWMMSFHQDKNILVIATKQETA